MFDILKKILVFEPNTSKNTNTTISSHHHKQNETLKGNVMITRVGGVSPRKKTEHLLNVDYKAPNNDPQYIEQIHVSIIKAFNIPTPNPGISNEGNDYPHGFSSIDGTQPVSPLIEISKRTSLSPSLPMSTISRTTNTSTCSTSMSSLKKLTKIQPLSEAHDDFIPKKSALKNGTGKRDQTLRYKSSRLTTEQRDKMINFDYKYVKTKRFRMYINCFIYPLLLTTLFLFI